METIKENRGLVAAFVIALLAVVLLLINGNARTPQTEQAAAAAETEQQAPANDTTESEAAQTESTESSDYSYVAQPGDSYSVLARKAIQTYGINESVNLSRAHIVAAETNLTVQAGSPELNEGQSVTITQSAVKSAIDAAQKLTADEKAAWQTYVSDVDFRTNDNGE